MIIPVELTYFVIYVTHSMNIHVNTREKGKPTKAVRDGSIIVHFD